MTPKDRRKYVRLEKTFRTKHGIIKVNKKIPVQYDLSDSVELKYSSHTKDICEGGLCLENKDLKELLKTSIKEGTELKLKISITGTNSEDINTVGRVAWIDLKRDLCGIEFITLHEYERRKIRNYVRDEYFRSYKR
ncbi:MAG: PilZ domain-containing protein [Nanoarchaeota archaeon]|nr:PilZ domain-containing protein [Nanoarchaeota archaeon]